MKRWLVCLAVGLLAFGSPAQADIVGLEEEEEGLGGVNVSPIRAGRLEITPIMSLRFAGGNFLYRGGVQVAVSLNRWHQIGGSFVAGNRQYDRLARRDFSGLDQSQSLDNATVDARGRYLTVDEGFGSSVSGFYRLNIPIQIQKRTFPFVELFGARDFWGWGDVGELGGGAGVRKMISKRTTLNTMYGYSVLFAGGDRITRHFVAAGVSVFFR